MPRYLGAQLDRRHLGAVTDGGRGEVYEFGDYEPTRRLNDWAAPINDYCEVLVEKNGSLRTPSGR